MAALAGTCFYAVTSILHCLPQPKQGAVSTLQLLGSTLCMLRLFL